MCQEHMLNNLCIFCRNMKLHEQDVEVFVMYVLNFGVHRSMLYTLLLWNRLFGEGSVQIFAHRVSLCCRYIETAKFVWMS